MRYRVPKREFEFVLREVMNIEQLTQYPGYEEVTWEMLQMITDRWLKLRRTSGSQATRLGIRLARNSRKGR